jgi:hypothetical protein
MEVAPGRRWKQGVEGGKKCSRCNRGVLFAHTASDLRRVLHRLDTSAAPFVRRWRSWCLQRLHQLRWPCRALHVDRLWIVDGGRRRLCRLMRACSAFAIRASRQRAAVCVFPTSCAAQALQGMRGAARHIEASPSPGVSPLGRAVFSANVQSPNASASASSLADTRAGSWQVRRRGSVGSRSALEPKVVACWAHGRDGHRIA